MTRYHYNPDTGKVGTCRADHSKPNSKGCRFKLSENEHYETAEQASKAYESTQDPFAKTIASNGKELSLQQEKYFQKSAIRDPEGKLLEVHHGSTVDFDSFDPSKVGKGEDSWGNGFYFTADKSTADSYSGGKGAKSFYLAINNPLKIDGVKEMSLNNVRLTEKQNLEIALAHPDLMIQPNENEDRSNPLEDYSDEYWSREKHTPQQLKAMAIKVAKENLSEASWVDLESYYGRDNGHALLKAAHKATGYDGVEVDFGEGIGKNLVAWFPEQIKSISNTAPSSSDNVNS